MAKTRPSESLTLLCKPCSDCNVLTLESDNTLKQQFPTQNYGPKVWQTSLRSYPLATLAILCCGTLSFPSKATGFVLAQSQQWWDWTQFCSLKVSRDSRQHASNTAALWSFQFWIENPTDIRECSPSRNTFWSFKFEQKIHELSLYWQVFFCQMKQENKELNLFVTFTC